MSSITDSLASQALPAAAPAAKPPATVDDLASEQTFLKLLVAQIKNQNPLTPTDPVQFVGQLTQYSELEQLIGIRTGVQQLTTPETPAPQTTSPETAGPQPADNTNQ